MILRINISTCTNVSASNHPISHLSDTFRLVQLPLSYFCPANIFFRLFNNRTLCIFLSAPSTQTGIHNSRICFTSDFDQNSNTRMILRIQIILWCHKHALILLLRQHAMIHLVYLVAQDLDVFPVMTGKQDRLSLLF